MTTTVTWFPDVTLARSAVLDLVTGGVPRDDISVLIPATEPGTETAEVPPFAASLLDPQSLTLPGMGAVAAAGPLAQMLASAATDGGDLQSVVAATGAPANQVASVLTKLQNGGALLAVRNNPAHDLIVQGVLRHTLDPDALAQVEQVGPAPDDEAVPAEPGGPISRSVGAMTGGAIPGSWGPVNPLDEPTPEVRRDPAPEDRGL
jgi:hypothetical protein